MASVQKYESELDDALEICLTAFPEAEDNMIAFKNSYFTKKSAPEQIKSVMFSKIRAECTDEIKQIWKTIEGGSDINAASTVDYIVNGYSLYDESEQILMAGN